MAFRNTLLEQIVEMPDLSGHWLYNFNTLRDKNESVTEMNKIGSAQIAAPLPPPPTALTPCTSTVKGIETETLINKVQGFKVQSPIFYDKSCPEYKNALEKN